MAFARLPDSKRDSNTKSSSDTTFRCAFIKYLELPTHDRLNCVTLKQSSNDLYEKLLLCLVLHSASAGAGAALVSIRVEFGDKWVLLTLLLSTSPRLGVALQYDAGNESTGSLHFN